MYVDTVGLKSLVSSVSEVRLVCRLVSVDKMRDIRLNEDDNFGVFSLKKKILPLTQKFASSVSDLHTI